MNETNHSSTAAIELLRSLKQHGVKYVFANLGTDHTPLLEGIARLRDADRTEEIPDLIVCPHEFVAMSAAHGYATITGEPQAVLVHVDVGTQNLGAAMHNAHRCDAPVIVLSGLAPVTESGHIGSRDNAVHYLQDVFDQSGIVREYCRWTDEFQPPAHPEPFVARAIERARGTPNGPVYLTASREALETIVPKTDSEQSVQPTTPQITDDNATRIAQAVSEASAPLLITSKIGARQGGLNAVKAFVERAGAGVVEHRPLGLALPRDHELHVGFDPHQQFERADLLLAVDTDVPWLPSRGEPDEIETIFIDPAPNKPTYPQWSFSFDRKVAADSVHALNSITEKLEADESGGERWHKEARARRRANEQTLANHRERNRLTPEVLTDLVADAITPSTIVVEDSVTSRSAVVNQLGRSEPGSYIGNGGAGLGWATGAAIGAKLAQPDSPVVSLVGDGAYLFGHPTASAWLSIAAGAPTLTVIYDNHGWNAVKRATLKQHPEGEAAAAEVPGARFTPELNLSAPAQAVDAFTRVVRTEFETKEALTEAMDAINEGRPAVIDAKIESI